MMWILCPLGVGQVYKSIIGADSFAVCVEERDHASGEQAQQYA
jgi:hypothetical protein